MIPFVRITEDTSINECISLAFQLISKLEEAKYDNIKVNLSQVNYPSPFFVMPLLSYSFLTNEVGVFSLSNELKDILFPMGLRTGEMRLLLLKSMLNEFGDKVYLPIIEFPSLYNDEDVTSNIVSIVESALYAQLGTKHRNVINGLRYVIGEMVDNVTQHSQSSNGYFFSLINKEKQYVDIGIADRGVGLLGSYKEHNDPDILTDIEAIQAANRGISTKNLPNAENRGFGLLTSKKMLIDGLRGVYVMISGNAMLIKTSSFNQYFEFSSEIRLMGTIVIFRIPLNSENFNYISYIE